MADKFDAHKEGLSSSCRGHELADFSGGDHEFAQLPREILVIGSGRLDMRLIDDTADLPSLTVGAGTLIRFPWRVSHVRSTSASTLTVVGLF